jgi:hypothetical protein
VVSGYFLKDCYVSYSGRNHKFNFIFWKNQNKNIICLKSSVKSWYFLVNKQKNKSSFILRMLGPRKRLDIDISDLPKIGINAPLPLATIFESELNIEHQCLQI